MDSLSLLSSSGHFSCFTLQLAVGILFFAGKSMAKSVKKCFAALFFLKGVKEIENCKIQCSPLDKLEKVSMCPCANKRENRLAF